LPGRLACRCRCWVLGFLRAGPTVSLGRPKRSREGVFCLLPLQAKRVLGGGVELLLDIGVVLTNVAFLRAGPYAAGTSVGAITTSAKPYSTACSAVSQRSLSVSFAMVSPVCPVCRARISIISCF